MLKSIILIFPFVMLSSSVPKTDIIEIKFCSEKPKEITTNINEVIVLTLKIHFTKKTKENCKIKFLFNSSLPKGFVFVMYLETLELIEFPNSKSWATLNISTDRYKSLLFLPISFWNSKINDLLLSHLLISKGYRWTENLWLHLEIYLSRIIIMKIILTPGFYCDEVGRNNFFQCFQSYLDMKVCIDNSLACDEVSNCPLGTLDESALKCKTDSFKILAFPFIIVGITIIFISWLFYKTIPCFMQIRRNRFRVYRQRLLFPIGNVQTLTADQSEVITTENLPNSPPIYNKPGTSSEHYLPPSYSQQNEIFVIPDFFFRFFGKPLLSCSSNSRIQQGLREPNRREIITEQSVVGSTDNIPSKSSKHFGLSEYQDLSFWGTLEAINSITTLELTSRPFENSLMIETNSTQNL